MPIAGNQLSQATSPYLLQHAHNPVHWRSWGPAALAEARALNRPIFLSIGYAACHWCHVMAHESFEDLDTSILMNARFVNIKLDREERPDIDHIYMAALHALGEQGGWPLSMFLTPEGAPFWGGTYFPPEPRWGRPSFRQVLLAIAEAWESDQPRIASTSASLSRRLAAQAATSPGAALTPGDLDVVTAHFLRQIDRVNGGIGHAPKFPNIPIFRFLWQEACNTGNQVAAETVLDLLEKMSQGGIYDHLGGGYSRYSTDAEWLAPHFEKMLYDNALILDLLALAYAAIPVPLFAQRAIETVGWLLRDMAAMDDADEAGHFALAAAEDADSEGVEGKFYVWSDAEITQILGEDAPFFAAHYDVTPAGNWEGHNILRRVLPHADAPGEAKLAACRAILFAHRAGRIRPGRDDKILTDWNALAIAALARASAVFARPDWLATARTIFAYLTTILTAPDGRINHAYRHGQISAPCMLDDQAAMIRAALALFEATGDADYLARATHMVAVTQTLFADEAGSFFITAADATDLPPAAPRPRHLHDGPTPSGVGLMAENYARLFHITGEPAWRTKLDRLVANFTGDRANLGASPIMLAAAAMLDAGSAIVILGDPASPDYAALHLAARAAPDPACIVLPMGLRSDLPPSHPAHGKTAGAQASAFVCRGGVCALPVTKADELRRVLPQPNLG